MINSSNTLNILSFKIPTMLTIKEAADKTGVAAHFIRHLAIKNEIVHVRCGKKYLINLEKFIEYLNTSKGNEKSNIPKTDGKFKITPVKVWKESKDKNTIWN